MVIKLSEIFILITILSTGFGAKLDAFIPTYFRSLEEPILINFPKRINFTRPTAQRFYLPPESITLPEVIDNRLRSSTWLDFYKLNQPDLFLQTPYKNNEREHFFKFRPSNTQTKQVPDFNSQDFDSTFVKVTEMSCRNSGEELYFRASLTPPKNTDKPIIENSGSADCQILKLNDEYKIDFSNNKFWNCGVVDCSNESENNFCLSLRFPIIKGLKLKDDFKITLQCRGQDKTASHVKKISVKSLDTNSRMVPRVAAGGGNDFQTDVALYRKTYNSENIFDKRIESGGTVILGEEILLRVSIREGDGWRYSKINDVTMYFVEKTQQKRIMNSLTILDANGCLNPQVRAICSREQHRVSPLESYLLFQAFMFENMKESDEMILSVKVTGCLDGADCILNCPEGHVRRSKRNSQNNRNQTIKWEDDIEFRILRKEEKYSESLDFNLAIPYALSALIFIAAGVLIYFCKNFRRQRFSRFNLS
ncbi:uncharacterized protein LOC117169964 [Belonocnema kinseyi]|uniref:uncharacterized protein LOC117169964 n=1 Tax=Belonocnema kinseyi TaxID=2817044 RepID=UPI00143D7AE9|nr:uncharacterized protein LOC117169964 [Belonocnema kinseyi]